jgi:hypothetical protein
VREVHVAFRGERRELLCGVGLDADTCADTPVIAAQDVVAVAVGEQASVGVEEQPTDVHERDRAESSSWPSSSNRTEARPSRR